MQTFEQVYKRLNTVQKQAVDTIDGPLLVIAGPGTGKTQLLSARVANILQRTDTLPQNVLCLTFTENGAANMRERLTQFIGQEAYNVTISTYHGFGSDIISRYPEYFTETRLERPIDQLGKHQVLSAIVDGLSYRSPLKQLQHHIGDLVSTISEVKRALLDASDLRAIATANMAFIQGATAVCAQPLAALSAMSRMSAKGTVHFNGILQQLERLVPTASVGPIQPIASLAHDSLHQALDAAETSGKTTSLTAWKNDWLAKDANNQFIFAGELENGRISALADVLENYQAALAAQGLYDFDDMILRTIQALQDRPDFKYSLQERYLYILLDEFQDTNAAQLKLVQLLTDNPVHEGRPNVMAVGDDDQAIYAFQGAEMSNMLDFYSMYRDVAVLSLTDNYRSHAAIIATAGNVAAQISARLHSNFDGMTKQLVAAGTSNLVTITHQELTSDVAQYDWIAQRIADLIQQGTAPQDIAVLAPKHKYLEPLVAHLNQRGIPVQYEKRENILESPIVAQLLTMARLVMALQASNHKLADALWPAVLSYEFWQIPVRTIWECSWAVQSQQRSAPDATWLHTLLVHPDSLIQTPAMLFAALALHAPTDSCETMLDYLIGTQTLSTNDAQVPQVHSALRAYYTSPQIQRERPDAFYQTISQLKVLQSKLREHQAAQGRTLKLSDLLAFVQMYQDAGEMLLHTSPYHQQTNAVHLMTVFKAKGLEFEHVFLPWLHDDVWGSSARGMRNNLTLPKNLAPLRHAGATDDERLRILFVAITRAKCGLYLTSFMHDYSGRATKRLKYLQTMEHTDGTHRTGILPAAQQVVATDDRRIPPLEVLELDWHARHVASLEDPDIRAILQQRLKQYQLSASHLNQFTDVALAGPQDFLVSTLLRFPRAPTPSIQFGNAIHETLEWTQHQTSQHGKRPDTSRVLKHFRQVMASKKLTDTELRQLSDRGEHALAQWLAERGGMFAPHNKAEHRFSREGVFVGDVHMTGNIDYLQIDTAAKTITIVDYKTGPPKPRWVSSDLSLHKYRQQLYCYKMLVEGSHTYAGYKVTGARLEFIEPDTAGTLHHVNLTFDEAEQRRVQQLIQAVWQRIQALAIPDTSAYKKDLGGVAAFEADLINEL